MNETGRLLALAILVVSGIAFIISAIALVRAMFGRSHVAYSMERVSASQKMTSAVVRVSLSLLGLAAGWVMATLFSATDAAPVAPATPPAVVYATPIPSPAPQNTLAPLATSTKLPAPSPTAGVIAPAQASAVPVAAATIAPTLTSIPPTKPASTNTPLPPTLAPTAGVTAQAAPTLVALPTNTRPAPTATPVPTSAPVVNLPKPDCADPGSAGILSPAHGETITSQRPVIVNAGVLSGESAKIEAQNDAGNWGFLARSTVGIKNGQLGSIDPSMFSPGVRQFRLVIVDVNQQERKICRIALILK
ncbi:MAG TPA: hypothetical protein PLJ62_12920 [Thermoflexales bacterium]|nr:hypothetical protein [Thermoflexales bacterium]HRA01099.1 hypothetical protein [Thermoflexales bacterium]